MEAFDSTGQEISEGFRVKYTRTHTTGKVNEIVFKNGYTWIKIDSTNLYYRNDYIELIEDKFEHKKPNKSQKLKSEQFKIKIPVEISDSTDGPGVGGG